VQSRAAYLLFYRRRAVRPIGGKSREKAQEASRAASPVPSSSSSDSESERDSDRRARNNRASSEEASPPKYASGLPTPPDSSVSSASDRGVYGDADGDDLEDPSVDLGSIGQDLGFGNTAWSSSSRSSDQAASADIPELAPPVDDAGPVGAVMDSTGSTESSKDMEAVDALTEDKPASLDEM
jgi:ubiquitin carboxyl-terminal hydrolase 4/11/15